MSLRRFLRAGVAVALLATGMIVAAPAAHAAEGTLTGSVVDDNGAAIGGGQVVLIEPEPGIAPIFADVAVDGTFSISGEPGGYYLMALPPSGSLLAASAPVNVASDCLATECSAVLTGGASVAVAASLALSVATVQGTVKDENGVGVPGAMVMAMAPTCMGGGGGGGGGDMDDDGAMDGVGGGGGDMSGMGGDKETDTSTGATNTESSSDCEEFFTMTSESGGYLLGASTGTWFAFAYNPANARMTSPAQISVAAGSVLTNDINFTAPNVTGTVQRASDGTPYANAFVMANECEQSMYETMGECFMMGEGAFGATGADGTFALAIAAAGVYSLEVEPAWGDNSVAGFSEVFVLAEGGSKATWGSPASAIIGLVAPNVTGTVIRPDTNTGISDIFVMAIPVVDGQEQWPPTAEGPSGEGGAYGFALAAGDYVFRAELPWWDSSLAGFMAAKQQVTVLGPASPQTVDLTLGVPNVSGTFKSATGTPVNWGWVEVCLAPGTDWQIHCQLTTADGGYPGGNIRENGEFSLNLHPWTRNVETYEPDAETAGPFTFTFWPDEFQNSGVAKTIVTVTMDDSETLNKQVASAEVGGVNVLQTDGTLAITAASPNLSGTVWNPVTDAAYTSAPNSWDRGHLCAENPTTWSWDCSGIAADGTFGIALDDGTYTIHAEPAWGTATLSPVSFTAVVASGTVTATGAAASQSAAGESVTVTLGQPNFTGTIKTSAGAGLGEGHMEIMKAVTEGSNTWYEWVNWANISDAGVFAQKVDNGTYKIQANPGWGMSGYAATEANVTINDEGVTCNSGCVNVAGPTDGIVLTWGSPNLAGVVINPSTTAGDPEAQLEIFKKVDGNGDGDVTDPEDWDQWETWAMASRTGTFGVRLDGGSTGETYTIKAMPGWRTTGVSATSYTVLVAANDTITSVTGPSGAVEPTEGSYSLSLSTPNVSGSVVKADGTTAAIDAHIDIQKWYDGSNPTDADFTDPEDYTQWEDWARSRPKVTGSGADAVTTANYGVSLGEGTYEVWVWPAWTDSTSIRQRTTVVVNSSLQATCGSGNVPAGLPTAGCAVDNSTGAVNFALATSNVAGDVANSEGAAVTWSSVDILKDSDSNIGNGYEEWVTWAEIQGGSTNAGKFAAYLEDGNYQLRVFPGWSDTKSQPKNVAIAVASGSASCTSGCTVGDTGRLVIALAAGNVTGTVQTSAVGNAGLGNALVMVVTDGDNGNGTFGDTDNERIADTTTGATGEFSVQVGIGGGYKLKIQPAPLASGTAVDVVTIDDTAWAVADDGGGDPGAVERGNIVLDGA